MNVVSAKPFQSLFDIAIQAYGNLTALVKLCDDNDLAYTDEITAGQKFAIEENTKYEYLFKLKQKEEAAINAVLVKPSQTIFDIALQEYGSISALFSLAEENNISVTDDINAGDLLSKTENSELSNAFVLSHYTKYKVIPATGAYEPSEVPQLQGIGYWKIGVDFKVS